MTDSSTEHTVPRRPVFPILVAAFLVFLTRFGYGFGFSDQDEFIPLLLSYMDPGLFENDWFVNTQRAAFSVRTYFVWLLRFLAEGLSTWWAVLIMFIGSWGAIGWALVRMGRQLSGHPLSAALAMGFTLVATPFWTLGGNDLAHSMLVPSMVAWAFALWGLAALLERHWLRGGVLIGVATLMQVLVGLQVAFIGGVGLLLVKRFDHKAEKASPEKAPSWKQITLFSGMYLLIASPALIPLIFQQLTTPGASAGSEDLFYVMAAFRNPHHYLFHSFSPLATARFFGLMGVGLISLAMLWRKRAFPYRRLVASLLAVIAVTCGFAYLFTEVWPILTIAKLQLFKLTVLAKWIFILLFCHLLLTLLPDLLSEPLNQLTGFQWWPWSIGALVSILFIFLVLRPDAPLNDRLNRKPPGGDSVVSVAQWASTSTPKDAVFLLPPSLSSFRSEAKRAIFVNHKSFPYRDADIIEWFKRLKVTAPLTLPTRADATLMAQLDTAFHRRPMASWLHLEEEYQFDYLIREKRFKETPGHWQVVFEAFPWVVYQTHP